MHQEKINVDKTAESEKMKAAEGRRMKRLSYSGVAHLHPAPKFF
jgi:hypothetical protein